MKIVVSGLERFKDWADERAKSMDVAALKALNRTAFDVRDAEYEGMRQGFDKPTPRTLRSLFVKTAKPQNLEAIVQVSPSFSGTPPERYLNPQVYGGPRRMKSFEKKIGAMVAPVNAPLDQYGNVRGSYFVKILSQLSLMSDAAQNATNSTRSKRKRKAESFFIAGNAILSRKGNADPVVQLVMLKRPPQYSTRLPFEKISQETFNKVFNEKFLSELRKARA